MNRPTLYMLSGPSGVGKSSLTKALAEQLPDVRLSVSHTTRRKKNGERDGREYHFVDEQTFARMREQGLFLEHARVFGHHYGTAKQWVREQLDAGKSVILEIDWQGAHQIKRRVRESVSIFLLPPSHEELKKRVKGRGRDDEKTVQKRAREAGEEIRQRRIADFLVFNENFEQALGEVRRIVSDREGAADQRRAAQEARHRELLEELQAPV